MQVSNQNISSSSLLRQNILEKANQAFSGGEKAEDFSKKINDAINSCLLYTSPSPRDLDLSRMPSSA